MSSGQSIFGPRYLALSIGIILAAMTIGFEGLAVTTVAPAIATFSELLQKDYLPTQPD
ncbi:hypothetical protein [uncultured Brevibacillus sp.]|uniref:hypothetical protein n=1 Tax=uncultured Brevibacillus sp. TaxID=169970 RepID=UPI0025953D42|nr:hypothetical protein [uncultured Brevibacillus sp.]